MKNANSSKSVDHDNNQTQTLTSSYEEQSFDSDLVHARPKIDHARIRMMKESEFVSYDKDISR